MTNLEFMESLSEKYNLRNELTNIYVLPMRDYNYFFKPRERAITVTWRSKVVGHHVGQKTFRKKSSVENFISQLIMLTALGEPIYG